MAGRDDLGPEAEVRMERQTCEPVCDYIFTRVFTLRPDGLYIHYVHGRVRDYDHHGRFFGPTVG